MAYMDAVKGLYGSCSKKEMKVVVKCIRTSKSLLMRSEMDEQKLLSAWLSKAGILHYHPANGGYRNKLEAYNLKMAGVKPGVPDICIPIAQGKWHGLYIELKREKGGTLSSAQRWWIEELTKQGYRAICCHGFDEAKKAIEEYLKVSNSTLLGMENNCDSF